MKRSFAYIAILTGGLMLGAPALAQDDVTMQVFEDAFVTNEDGNVLALPLPLDADPEAVTASQFGRSVAKSATEDGRALGDRVSGNVSGDARGLGDEMRSDFGSGLSGDSRELPERSLNLDLPSVP